ncbi:hypothetical protein [Micromonospora echinofusca]|uniref:hypothetical protein n=1 Tax=Micromonospora echinofusca TaxID=47858 RepID=UPI0027DB5729|nr:hypothetical protein [Micromonospora echinofusca]
MIERLLSSPFPGNRELLAQLAHTAVVEGCRCGCATVNLSVDRVQAAPAAVISDAPVSADICDGDTWAGLVLLVDDGYLACLEVYSIGEPVRRLPPPHTVRPRPTG